MKGINFKKPKYIIPLILLPFLFLGYYLSIQFSAGKHNNGALSANDSLQQGFNADVPGVGKKVEDEYIKNKFDAYREAYKKYDKQSPLAGITPNGNDKEEESILGYNEDERTAIRAKHTLDSINDLLDNQQSGLDREIGSMRKNRGNLSRSYFSSSKDEEEDSQKDVVNEFKRVGKTSEQKETVRGLDPYEQQMKMFREQMQYADSLEKANTESNSNNNAGNATVGKRNFNPRDDSAFKPLAVSANPSIVKPGFNTIQAFNKTEAIQAIIDQDEKAMAGTRIRIRLLQEIYVGGQLIPKGTYLYAIVTGFQISRLNLSISQIFYQNQTYPVSLDVFDNDGYLGLYVPGSAFREFTKEIGTQGTNGLSSLQTSDNSSPLSGLLNQLFKTTTTSATNLIKKEKAFVKYNYVIYLKENKQR
jgi:conjugative transposon TraM protein